MGARRNGSPILHPRLTLDASLVRDSNGTAHRLAMAHAVTPRTLLAPVPRVFEVVREGVGGAALSRGTAERRSFFLFGG